MENIRKKFIVQLVALLCQSRLGRDPGFLSRKEVKEFSIDPLCGKGTGDQNRVNEGAVTLSDHILSRGLDEIGDVFGSVLKDIKEALFDE